MVSAILVVIILALSVLFTRIASIALMHTGLSKQLARFQARSAFTGVGFTTNEAEKIVNHPVRRKIVMTLMLLGNAGIISVIASLLLTFIDTGESEIPLIYRLLILVISIFILWLLSTSKVVDLYLSRMISRALKKYTDLNVRDYAGLLHLSKDYGISELMVEKNDWIANKNLKETSLRDEGINVLGIKRENGTYIGVPTGNTEVLPGDLLILYGSNTNLQDLDERQKGVHGNIRHKEAINEKRKKEAEEKEMDITKRKVKDERS